MTHIIRFIGDVHGRFRQYRNIIRNCPESIQVGDMGVGFRGLRGGEIKELSNPPFDAMSQGNHRFIRGNHDNPQSCSNHPFWVADGEVLYDKIYCLGGASSIDRRWRTEGLDWWADEELPQHRLDVEVESFGELKPDIVVTHECPESIANQILGIFNQQKIADYSRTRLALEQMLYKHQPKLWIFGHWHKTMTFKSGDTVFKCLGELDFEDIDIDEY